MMKRRTIGRSRPESETDMAEPQKAAGPKPAVKAKKARVAAIRVPLSAETNEQINQLRNEKIGSRSIINKILVNAHVAAFKAAHPDFNIRTLVKEHLFGKG